MSSDESKKERRVIAILSGRGGRRVVVVLVSAAKGAGQRAVTWWDRLLIWLADDLFCIPVRRLWGFGKLSKASYFGGQAPAQSGLVFRRMAVLRALTAVAVALLIGALDLFGLSGDTSRFSRDAFYQYVAPLYPGTDRDLAASASLPEPSVLLLTETDLIDRGETWPASYGLHAEVLEELLDYDPAAVFVDIAFLDVRDDQTWGELVEVVCSYSAYGIPIYVASPRFIHAYRLAPGLAEVFQDVEVKRATRVHTLARAGAVPVAVPGGAFGRDGLVYPLGVTDKLTFVPGTAGGLAGAEAQKRQSYLDSAKPLHEIFAAYRPDGSNLAAEPSPCASQSAPAEPLPSHFPAVSNEGERSHYLAGTWGNETANRLFLPAAACRIYAEQGGLTPLWCKTEFRARARDGAMEVYWRFRSQAEEQFSQAWQGRDFHVRNGMGRNEGGRGGTDEVCGRYGEAGAWSRLVSLIRGADGGAHSSLEGSQPAAVLAPVPGPWLRETCPPFQYLTLSYLLPEGAGIMSRNREAVMERAVTGKVVMYGVQLVAVWDKVVPPTHWPLPGVFFHAMAYDNLRLRADDYIGEDTKALFAGLRPSAAAGILVLLLLAFPVEFYKTFVAELARVVGNARLGPRLLAVGYTMLAWAMVNVVAIALLVATCWYLFFKLNLSPVNFAGILALLVAYVSFDLLSNLRLLTRLSSHVEEADRRRLHRDGDGT